MSSLAACREDDRKKRKNIYISYIYIFFYFIFFYIKKTALYYEAPHAREDRFSTFLCPDSSAFSPPPPVRTFLRQCATWQSVGPRYARRQRIRHPFFSSRYTCKTTNTSLRATHNSVARSRDLSTRHLLLEVSLHISLPDRSGRACVRVCVREKTRGCERFYGIEKTQCRRRWPL